VQDHYEAIDIGLGRDGFFPNLPRTFAITRLAPKDIAGILIVMLRAAEIDADFAITATRDFGEVRAEFPALSQFNRAIVSRAPGSRSSSRPRDKSAGMSIPRIDRGADRRPDPHRQVRHAHSPQSTNARNSWAIAGA
jgi:hypothetical protein